MEPNVGMLDCRPAEPSVTINFPRELQYIAGIDISCFVNEIPPFVDNEIEKLYGSLYSSPKKFRIYGSMEGVNTYVARKNEEIVAIFLFRIKKKHLLVLNEVLKLNPEEIRAFCQAMFSYFNSIAVISFNAVEVEMKGFPFTVQKCAYSENLIISLPESAAAYTARLGNATRRNIKYYSNKIKRDYPSFNYRFYDKNEISEDQIKEILNFKAARMAEKGKDSGLDVTNSGQIMRMINDCNGMVGIATINGRICAGQVSYRIGKNDIASIIAHDPDYNPYSLGIICCYLTICECIERGGKEFNFLWGREEYKYRFLADHRSLSVVNIFRSPVQIILNPKIAMFTAFDGLLRRLRSWMTDPKNRENPYTKRLYRLIRYLRFLK